MISAPSLFLLAVAVCVDRRWVQRYEKIRQKLTFPTAWYSNETNVTIKTICPLAYTQSGRTGSALIWLSRGREFEPW